MRRPPQVDAQYHDLGAVAKISLHLSGHRGWFQIRLWAPWQPLMAGCADMMLVLVL